MASGGIQRSGRRGEGGGLVRFLNALRAVPDGGEASVWIRLPIKLGDVMMALPSVFAIKHAWEGLAERRGIKLRFTLMGKPGINLFRECLPQVFEACMVDGQSPFRNSPFSIRKYWGKAPPLAVINYSKSDRIKLAAWIGGVPVRAGIADGSFNWCYQFSEHYEKSIFSHRVLRYLPLTQWLAGPDVSLRFETLSPQRYGGTSVMGLLEDLGWNGGPYVVFGVYPHQQNPERRWLPGDESWIRLAQLALRDGVTPVLVGGPEHTAGIQRIASVSGCLCLVGKTDLPQLLALSANAIGTIAVDTGIAHVAAATGKPTVVIFGPGREQLDLPCGPKVIALRGNPVGQSTYPVGPIPVEHAASPWCFATHCIAAERAWGVLNYLAQEVPEPRPMPACGAGDAVAGAAAEVSIG